MSVATPAGRHQWALSLFRQPAHYTALYFNHPLTLRREISRSAPVPLVFTIQNNEGTTIKYDYIVTSDDGVNHSVLYKASRKIASDSQFKVAITIHPKCILNPCRIQVALPGHPETIDFLLGIRF